MLHGIERELDPGAPVEGNGYAQAATGGLPLQWNEAVDRAARSEFLADALGAEFLEVFVALKRRELEKFGAKVDVYDPWADPDEAEHEYGLRPVKKLRAGTYDAVVMGVAHDEFRKMGIGRIRKLARKNHVLYDIKYVFRADEVDGRL